MLDLIERFELHADTYRRQEYNETQVRREFIDPLFAALGWDVDNESGHAEAYKDVIHEDAIKVGGSTKAPDYCFRIGGVRKFFVEAKKPSVSVGDDPGPAYQLRRYAWSNKLPLSIVTDFEEFAVYDCRIKPRPDDKPSTARVLYLKCDEFPKRWDEIASIFSKDAILKGSFDKYAESNKRKRGTAEVDDEFLKEIESWRDELARNIALRNPQLSVRNLNYAVGKTIDRIIFLRMCEDRGVETYAQLRLLLNGPRVYPRMVEIFYRADQRYNSGLFHFEPEKDRPDEPDTLTPNLTIDDKVLKGIIKGLYYPDCAYEFSVMPPEILGQVYEQFLGKVIRLTKGHQAVVEEKPEVKKAGGVYYTPKYIVDYIVEHTVGELLKDKKPSDVGPMLDAKQNPERKRRADQSRTRKEADDASPLTKGGSQGGCLRILDPACGSGSFLLGAFQTLLNWHLQWYSQNGPEKWAKKKTPPIYQVGYDQSRARKEAESGNERKAPLPAGRGSDRGAWRLTITEKKRILLNNIYGVDIDPQAVEVTKLSLLLKVLEGESGETIGHTLRLFHERALPDLGGNIKCGNSLIGPDFYDNQQLELLDDEERYRINIFDWQAEFPEVFQSRAPVQSRARKEADSPARGDETAPLPHGRGSDQTGGFDAVIGNPPYGSLLSDSEREYVSSRNDCFGVYPDSYVAFLDAGVKLLRQGGHLGMIIPSAILGGPMYTKIRRSLLARARWTYTVMLPYDVFRDAYIDTCIVCLQRSDTCIHDHDVLTFEYPKRARIAEMGGLTYRRVRQSAWLADSEQRIILDPSARALLSVLAERTGATLGEFVEIRRGVLPSPGSLSTERTKRHQDRYFEGNVYRYVINSEMSRFVAFDDSLRERPRDRKWFDRPRILLRRLVNRKFRLMASLADAAFITNKNLYSVLPRGTRSLPFILGVLNSKLVSYLYVKQVTQATKDDFAQVTIKDISSMPFPATVDSKVEHRMIELIQRMLDLHKRLAATITPTDKTAIQRQIDATDRQIDQLVYELYGLTDEEIRIVEEATQR